MTHSLLSITEQVTLLSAFFTGILGSVHCVGMCGGIAGALTLSLPNPVRQSHSQFWKYLLSYHLGRLSSYIAAGIMVGFLGTHLTTLFRPDIANKISLWLTGGLMIALGLHLGQWWPALVGLERLGQQLWKRVEPLGRRFLPVKTLRQAYGVGFLWGGLPCGLSYSVLVLPFTAASAWQGGLLMLVFGLGTLPMLLTVGTTTRWFTLYVRKLEVQRVVGTLLIFIWIIYLSIQIT
ncbi:MAG: hypothetical protein BWK78_07190 [Thiotrichaceae bacterium IS1]|nr:MAG: hypothetical protein BWK78_07190 [Thiotrichaceae bacterium IS1]